MIHIDPRLYPYIAVAAFFIFVALALVARKLFKSGEDDFGPIDDTSASSSPIEEIGFDGKKAFSRLLQGFVLFTLASAAIVAAMFYNLIPTYPALQPFVSYLHQRYDKTEVTHSTDSGGYHYEVTSEKDFTVSGSSKDDGHVYLFATNVGTHLLRYEASGNNGDLVVYTDTGFEEKKCKYKGDEGYATAKFQCNISGEKYIVVVSYSGQELPSAVEGSSDALKPDLVIDMGPFETTPTIENTSCAEEKAYSFVLLNYSTGEFVEVVRLEDGVRVRTTWAGEFTLINGESLVSKGITVANCGFIAVRTTVPVEELSEKNWKIGSTVQAGPMYFSTSVECAGVHYDITIPEKYTPITGACNSNLAVFNGVDNINFLVMMDSQKVVAQEIQGGNVMGIPCKWNNSNVNSATCEKDDVTISAYFVSPQPTSNTKYIIGWDHKSCMRANMESTKPSSYEASSVWGRWENGKYVIDVTTETGTFQLVLEIDQTQGWITSSPNGSKWEYNFQGQTLIANLDKGMTVLVYIPWFGVDNPLPVMYQILPTLEAEKICS